MSRGHRHRIRAWHVGLAALTLGLYVKAWQVYPVPTSLGTAAVLTLLAAYAWWRTRRWWLRRQTRLARDTPGYLAALPTDGYQHWFREDLIAPYVAAGWPREMFGYTGITVAGRYATRCNEHAGTVGDQASWWWPLVDPALSGRTKEPFRTRVQAEAWEAAQIRRYCGVGNITHNPRYREQTLVREQLRQLAADVTHGYRPAARPARRRRLLAGAR